MINKILVLVLYNSDIRRGHQKNLLLGGFEKGFTDILLMRDIKTNTIPKN